MRPQPFTNGWESVSAGVSQLSLIIVFIYIIIVISAGTRRNPLWLTVLSHARFPELVWWCIIACSAAFQPAGGTCSALNQWKKEPKEWYGARGMGDYWLTLLGWALGGSRRRGELGGGVRHCVLSLPPVPFVPLLWQRQDLLQRLRGAGACRCLQERWEKKRRAELPSGTQP